MHEYHQDLVCSLQSETDAGSAVFSLLPTWQTAFAMSSTLSGSRHGPHSQHAHKNPSLERLFYSARRTPMKEYIRIRRLSRSWLQLGRQS